MQYAYGAQSSQQAVGIVEQSTGSGEVGGGDGGGSWYHRPPTLVGLLRLVVVLSPSWPSPFPPQHLRSMMSVRYAHVWPQPASSTSTAPSEVIVVGVLRLVFVPSPS